ncbi:MAG: phytoene/squalene synthase family protein, partial [Pseudobdellovibrionaceae bacterium]
MSLDRRSVVLEKAVSALKKGSLTFSFASEFLGRSSKESAALFYHWCREVDDSIDDVEEPAKSLFLKAAQLSLMQFKQNQKLEILSAGWASLEILLQTHPRLIIFCQDLLRGMEMDLQNVDITDEANLDDYCYCVAGSVGAAMCVINGIEDEKTLESAIAYGKALQ